MAAYNRWQINGLKFRRQVSIGKFIVDFYCSELQLVIGLDDSSHLDNTQSGIDKERDRLLVENGFTVVRYLNNAIDENLEGVLEDICRCCEQIQTSATSP